MRRLRYVGYTGLFTAALFTAPLSAQTADSPHAADSQRHSGQYPVAVLPDGANDTSQQLGGTEQQATPMPADKQHDERADGRHKPKSQ